MTADKVDVDVTNQLLCTDPCAVQDHPRATSSSLGQESHISPLEKQRQSPLPDVFNKETLVLLDNPEETASDFYDRPAGSLSDMYNHLTEVTITNLNSGNSMEPISSSPDDLMEYFPLLTEKLVITEVDLVDSEEPHSESPTALTETQAEPISSCQDPPSRDKTGSPISDLLFDGLSVTSPARQDSALDPRQLNSNDDRLSAAAPEDNGTDSDHDTHVLILLSQEAAYEGVTAAQVEGPGMGHCVGPGEPPATTVEDSVMVTVTPPEEPSDSPNSELWLDAYQYQAGEGDDNEDHWMRVILEEYGQYGIEGGDLASSDLLQNDTKVSGYTEALADAIGQPSGDSARLMPPMERWPSEDSWSSALSDWATVVASPPEDFTAAFAEVGAQIEALTQTLAAESEAIAEALAARELQKETQAQIEITHAATQLYQPHQSHTEPPMAIQDQTVVDPGTSIITETQPEESNRDSSKTTPKGPGESQTTQDDISANPTVKYSSLDSSCGMLASPGGYNLDRSPAAPDKKYASSADLDDFVGGDNILLHITEDGEEMEEQKQHLQLYIEEPNGHAVPKLTEEDAVSQLGSMVDKEGGERSYGTVVTISDYPCAEGAPPKVERVFGPPAPHLPSTCSLKNIDSSLAQTQEEEPKWGGPQFIMPLAPFSIGLSSFRRTHQALEGDQDCVQSRLDDQKAQSGAHIKPNEPPAAVGSRSARSLEIPPDRRPPNTCVNTLVERTSSDDPGVTFRSERSLKKDCLSPPSSGQKTSGVSSSPKHTDTVPGELNEELSDLLFVSGDNVAVCEEEHVAYVTLDLRDPVLSRATITPSQPESKPHCVSDQKKTAKMPHKTAKTGSEGKPRTKKDKSAGCHLPPQAGKKQESVTRAPHPLTMPQVAKIQENHLPPIKGHGDEEASLVAVIENIAITEKATSKPHGKKKKKHAQNAAIVKSEAEPLVEVENGARQKTGAKGKIEIFETKSGAKAVKVKEKLTTFSSKKESGHSGSEIANPLREPACPANPLKDDVIKRRRLTEDKFGKRLQKFENVVQIKKEETMASVWKANKKPFSDVVKPPTPREAPREVQPIQAVAVSDDPQSLCLWCQFTAVFIDHTVTWTKEGVVQAEVKRSSGDESRVSMNISKASNKDLGRYQCRLRSSHGALALDYLLTYEVLSEIVIPAITKSIPTAPVEVVGEEENVSCCPLLFREDFLKDQYFGENQAASLITERVHFGEGMHRRAFRAKLLAGMATTFTAGHACVLKVHNAVAYGTRNNDEMVQKNYNLAVEECCVQNTAREYINAYNVVAQSAESFGDVPEIIPVYLVHRPSNDVPYATLEEELKGDFVKYSVRDGKEINLMRRDSEAGQKCCSFQHWIYHSTDGNLLVTDMQGVGMRLTDVGIATRDKGYKGFKGNCATSFIDQFKALHLCNKYCELLGLKSLQPKPKKHGHAPKSQTQPAAKKNTVGQTVKNKS